MGLFVRWALRRHLVSLSRCAQLSLPLEPEVASSR